jgi:hypothetical protein
MQIGAQEVAILTRKLVEGSAVSIGARDKHKFADSGEHLRRGTAKFAQLRPSLIDYFNTHGPGSMAELQDYSMVTGVASIADERARPELGFQVVSDKDERRRRGLSLQCSGGDGSFYSLQGRPHAS